MVGVPGRSKGCQKCRDRRIKCDEERPACNRCTRVGYRCPGYARNFTFVSDRTPRSPVKSEVDIEVNIEGNHQRRISSVEEGDVVQSLLILARGSTSPRSLLPHRADQYVDIFIKDFLLTSHPHKIFPSDNLMPYRFGHIIAPYSEDSERGRRCKFALEVSATSYVGQRLKVKDIQIDGQKRYAQLLAQVRRSVAKGSTQGIEFLYACMMAANYEFITAQSSLAWIPHLTGLGEVIRAQGPFAFQGEFPRHLLNTIRGHYSVSRMVTGERCFLASRDWIEIPWQGADKNLYDRLMDVQMNVPNVLREARELPRGGNYDIAIGGILSTLDSFNHWREAWEVYMQPQYLTIVPAMQGPCCDDLGPIHSTVLFFKNLSIASTYMLYNTWMIILGLCSQSLVPWLRNNEWDALVDINFHCSEICRLLDFFFQPEYRRGSTGVFVALKVGYDALKGTESRVGKVFANFMQSSIVGERAEGAKVNDIVTFLYGPPPF